MNESISLSILLAAPDGITSRSMLTLLGTIAQIGIVRHVIDLPTVLESLRSEKVHSLLLDDELLTTAEQDQLSELGGILRLCHSIQPDLAVSVLLCNLHNKNAIQELGAQALLKGMLDEELRQLPAHVFAATKPAPILKVT